MSRATPPPHDASPPDEETNGVLPRTSEPRAALHPTPEPRPTLPDAASLELLGEFCREELAATRTYEKALSLRALAGHTGVLCRCLESHKSRAAELAKHIDQLGGRAPTVAGTWGSFLGTLAKAVGTVNQTVAMTLLEEAEDHGVRRYRADVSALDRQSQKFVIERIVPEQARTQREIAEHRRSMAP